MRKAMIGGVLAHTLLLLLTLTVMCLPAAATEMTLSAAASLTNPFTELKGVY